MAQPSIASSVMPVSRFRAALAGPLRVLASRSKVVGVALKAWNSASSGPLPSVSISSLVPGRAESTVPPTSVAS